MRLAFLNGYLCHVYSVTVTEEVQGALPFCWLQCHCSSFFFESSTSGHLRGLMENAQSYFDVAESDRRTAII